MRGLFVALIVAGCSSGDSAPKPAQQPAQKPVPIDAGAPRPVPVDPGNNMHLDDDVGHPTRPAQGNRQGHPIDIMLRSTPNQADGRLAEVYVDGQPIGTTPAYWAGTADGRQHTFTFVLGGYETAVYRFVPITSGVIHARLTPVSDNETDAGVPEVVAPPPAPADAPSAPPPPITVVPDAAQAPAVPPTGPQP